MRWIAQTACCSCQEVEERTRPVFSSFKQTYLVTVLFIVKLTCDVYRYLIINKPQLVLSMFLLYMTDYTKHGKSEVIHVCS